MQFRTAGQRQKMYTVLDTVWSAKNPFPLSLLALLRTSFTCTCVRAHTCAQTHTCTCTHTCTHTHTRACTNTHTSLEMLLCTVWLAPGHTVSIQGEHLIRARTILSFSRDSGIGIEDSLVSSGGNYRGTVPGHCRCKPNVSHPSDKRLWQLIQRWEGKVNIERIQGLERWLSG